jgi:hypothetical protein
VRALKLTQDHYVRALASLLMDESSRARPVRRSISEGRGQLGAGLGTVAR